MECFSSVTAQIAQDLMFSALWPASQGTAKRRSGREATRSELLTISARRHGPAILLTDQRDGSVGQTADDGRLDQWGTL
jgi:hypothetical protein